MTKQKKYFPAQKDSEKVYAVIRRHWFTYLIFWLLALLMSLPLIILIIYWVNYPENISEHLEMIFILLASAYVLFMLALQIYGFIDYYLDVYIVTDSRIVDIAQNGFFKRSISELNLKQIQDVNAVVQGVSATLFHFGDVDIQTAAEKDNFLFRSVPHPYRVSKQILDLQEAYMHHSHQKKENENVDKNNKMVENIANCSNLEIGDSKKS